MRLSRPRQKVDTQKDIKRPYYATVKRQAIMSEYGYHYTHARHRAWRQKVLKRAGYLCEECKRYGRLDKNGNPVAAVTAHHIQHLEDRPDLAYDVTNGQALCLACHNKKHPEKGGDHNRR